MKEKVSIIVPIYNVVQYLEKCINSICNQTYKNIEIIMVDDCSTDGSRELAKELSKKDDRITFVQRSKNGGLSAARNTGMKIATGNWITFVDSDDWVREEYIRKMVEVGKKDQADIVMSSIYYYYKNGYYKEVSPFFNLTTQSSQKEKVAYSKPYAVTKLFKSSFLKKENLDFPENVWRAAEQGLIIPLLTKTEKISILQEPLYFYYQREDSNSNNNKKGIDTSFYTKSVENVFRNSNSGFYEELEYRAIVDLMYGMVMIMIRSNKKRSDILEQIELFNQKYLNWRKNKYLKKLNKGKRVFIYFASKKQIRVLQILIIIWDMLLERKK